MKISQLFEKKKVVFSVEVFPPKKSSDIDKILPVLDEVKALSPDYVSVTYGAGGDGGMNTIQIAKLIKEKYSMLPLAHLTCINSTKDIIDKRCEELKKEGIENVMALRGDRVEGRDTKDFAYASELVTYIKDSGYDFSFSGGCYPECHPECDNIVKDIRNLKKKVDSGVSHLNSQMFFDNEEFFRFMDMVRLAGINVPVQAGIMPITKESQISRSISLSGAKIPNKMSRMVAKFADKPESLQEAGIAYAIDQIVDLLSSGVDGIHLYMMNSPYVARKIIEAVRPILNDLNA